MQKITKLSLALSLVLLIASCGNSAKEGNAAINDKKAQLEKLKNEKDKNDAEIKKLQDELAKIDTSNANPAKVKLVALSPVTVQNFQHFIELQGKVDAENISYISPRGMASQVKAVLVRQGDVVKKGQLLLKLDDAILRQQVVASKQQSGSLNAQLSLARTVYQRQKNLWDQGIGTEVQLLNAQTSVTSLENNIQQVNEQVKLAQEQLKTANVYSDVSGVADVVNIRVGETFSGNSNNGPQIKIVNTSSLKATSNIPENYASAVNRGTAVVVELPDVKKTFNTSVSFIGASIDAANRGFIVEAKLPSDPALKPNQIATMKIRDYNSANAIAIPLNTLQNDEKGKYVMIAVTENGKMIARKRPVAIGMLNNDLIEIKGGLKAGDQLVTEGYSGLYEGQVLKTQ